MKSRSAARRSSDLLTLAPGGMLAAALATGMLAGGCTSDQRYEDIKADPTPEMLTLYQRDVDADNAWTVTRNENWRMFWQDLGRAALTDRPSRLTRETIPRP